MGFFKLFIKTGIILCVLLFIFCCKPKPKTLANTKEKIIASKVIKIKDSVKKLPSYLTKEYVLGKFKFTQNEDFKQAAEKDSISFKIVSGTRNFYDQKGIWNRKWKKYASLQPIERALKILEYSSMPTTSRHHWGTDIDINNLNSSYFKQGVGKKEYDWLQKNAAKFGFYQVYTSKENGRTGYNEEEWHWSYAPLSTLYLNYYNTNITSKDISGFEGEKLADSLHIIKNYVNGINPELLNLKN